MPHQSIDDLEAGLRAGDRVALARAITLIESHREDDASRAAELLGRVRDSAPAHRIGITGVPGVGKSTLIEALGLKLVEAGHRVAVLAVDPSSTLSGGSILGDKARMDRLSQDDRAFIRPSPSATTLGGVARRTRETAALCEAAGYDVVLIETVGVGQSEVAVADMVDVFVALMLPGAGDELQGIKKGLLELADLVVVNKADSGQEPLARVAVQDYSAALRITSRPADPFPPRAMAVSARTGAGLDEMIAALEEHREAWSESGALAARREGQRERWLWNRIEEELLSAFRSHEGVSEELQKRLSAVREGGESPEAVARRLVDLFQQ